MDDIVDELREVGFSLYEARLYTALLRHGRQNGNELARNSGVPSSKVYAAVEKLANEGSVQSITTANGTQFVALDPRELIAKLRRRFGDPLDHLEQHLPTLAEPTSEEAFLNVGGAELVVEAAHQILDTARKQVHISLWEPEREALAEALAAAHRRRVKIFGMLYSDTDEQPKGSWVRHSYEEIVRSRVDGRILSLVVDGEETLVARFADDGSAAGVRTRNPVLTLIVSEYLHHDMVLQRAQVQIGYDQWDKWWQADPDLRTRILGRTLTREAAPASAAKGARRKRA